MKKPFRLLLAGLIAAVALAPAAAGATDISGSGLTAGGTPQQLGKAASYGAKKVTVSMPGENPVDGSVNPITGESWNGQYNLTLVTIDTHPNALPNWGVGQADLIYEMPIQADGSTRSLALFMGEYPQAGAGPVRSARVAMCSLREMWGGTYCFYGYQAGGDKNNVKEWIKKNSETKKLAYPAYLNGMSKNAAWFPRSNDGGHVSPYNVRMNIQEVLSDYSLNPTPHAFLFTGEGLDRGANANGIVINYKETNPAYETAYQYNASTGLYERYRNGSPYTDGNNGEQCAFANVIVLRTEITWSSGNPSRPVIRLNGEGVCEIFQNGKYIRGTWARNCTETDNLQNRMVFFDENGQELEMKVGKTFIQIVENEQPVIVFSEDSIPGALSI